MAHILRLIPAWGWFLVGCLLAGVPQIALADTYSAIPKYRWSGKSVWESSPDAAYAAYGVSYPCGANGSFVDWTFSYPTVISHGYPSTNGSEVTYAKCSANPNNIQWSSMQRSLQCPHGGTVSGSSCVNAPACVAPQVRDSVTGQCVDPPEPCLENAGKWWSEGYGWNSSFPVENFSSGSGAGIPSTGCVSGCTVTYERSMGAYGSGQWWQIAAAKATGQSCSATTPVPVPPTTGPKTPETSPEYDCAKSGQGWGTVNGTVVCTGPATEQTKTDKDTTKTTNPDGTKTTTTKETACTGGTCTETTTTTNCDANGENCTSSTSTSEKTGQGDGGEGEGDEPESKWGGTCGSEPACSGDAIQCAQTKAVWEMNCRYRASDGQTTAEKIVAGNDPKAGQMPWAEGNIQQTNVSTMLNTNEQFGAACVPDLTFSVAGKVVVVPLSNACNWLGWIGNIMLAGAMLAGLAIAFGRPQ